MQAEVDFACGRSYLSVAGVVVAMEGDQCRDSTMPDEVYEPIPEEELATATIGGKPVRDMPADVVRLFRGTQWTRKMLQFVADKINERDVATETLHDDFFKEQREIRMDLLKTIEKMVAVMNSTDEQLETLHDDVIHDRVTLQDVAARLRQILDVEPLSGE